jgi:hypothetical protein
MQVNLNVTLKIRSNKPFHSTFQSKMVRLAALCRAKKQTSYDVSSVANLFAICQSRLRYASNHAAIPDFYRSDG